MDFMSNCQALLIFYAAICINMLNLIRFIIESVEKCLQK